MKIKVTVIAFNLHNWTQKNEKLLNEELKEVEFIYLDATRQDFIPWVISSLMEKTAVIITSMFPNNIYWSSMAVGKRNWLLLCKIKKYTQQPDLVIAHNPAAFYPAYRFSRQNNIPFSLDIEDYHPGESASNTVKNSVSLLLKKLLPKAAYTSFASPLIKKYTEKLTGWKGDNSIVVNNLFPRKEFAEPFQDAGTDRKIKLIWFSQYIDFKRGLEKILPVLDKFPDEFELTLIGNTRKEFYETQLKFRQYINCKDTMSHADLQKELGKHDIGLAIEDASGELNRDICLTNKIWSYFQSGLFIIATDTTAQKAFIKEHLDHGICTSLAADDLQNSFKTIVKNKEHIITSRNKRFMEASNYNWENESLSLVSQWELVFK